MREIKFRAWDKQKKEMLIALDIREIPVLNCGLGIDDNFELMQYTGLKDKNGKEIYEGDVLDFTVFDCFDHDTQYKGVVVYSGSRFMIWNKPDDEYYGGDGAFDLDYVVSQDCELEVIGNIYENPELIKEQK